MHPIQEPGGLQERLLGSFGTVCCGLRRRFNAWLTTSWRRFSLRGSPRRFPRHKDGHPQTEEYKQENSQGSIPFSEPWTGPPDDAQTFGAWLLCVFLLGRETPRLRRAARIFCLGSSFIGLGNYHPSFAARSWGLRCFLLAMQWAPHSQVPMAMPQMAGYPQMAATETAHGVGPTGAQCAPELWQVTGRSLLSSKMGISHVM